ncbi:MAG TPA: RNA-binding domain-containing protein [Nitrososphaerales archaeon]|nr:RNA-binding domain-containing protein [Nitrososphaerales archaeon]
MSLELRAGVSRSEDPEKVLKAMKNLLGEGEGEYQVMNETNSITVSSGSRRSLERIRHQLRDRRVRSAARRLFLTRSEGGSVSIMLNRQAAVEGIVALCNREDESPLGPIYLKLESDHLGTLIDWLTAYEVW